MPRGSLDLGHCQTTCLAEAGAWDVFPQDSVLDAGKWPHRLSGCSGLLAALTPPCTSPLARAHSCSGFLCILNPVGQSLGS